MMPENDGPWTDADGTGQVDTAAIRRRVAQPGWDGSAAAREAVPALCDEVDRLRLRGRDLEGALAASTDGHAETVAERDEARAALDQVRAWIDEAPEHTAGLDLLRQITTIDRVRAWLAENPPLYPDLVCAIDGPGPLTRQDRLDRLVADMRVLADDPHGHWPLSARKAVRLLCDELHQVRVAGQDAEER